MRLAFLSAVLALTASVLVPTATASYHSGEITHSSQLDFTPSNVSLQARTSSSVWYQDQCRTVSGTYKVGSSWWNCYDVKYDLGCVCLSSLSDFCDNNGISDYVESWIRSYLTSSSNPVYNYPHGCQPTCSSGQYTCPQGTINAKDGTCSSVPASCGASRCAQSDRTCCPTGCTKRNGKCVTTGSGPSCSSPNVLSNNICCPSGYTGYTKACCPSGQIEDPDNVGTCMCTDSSQKMDTSSQKCVSKCGSGLTWYNSAGICCGNGATPVNGQCACTSDQQKYDTSLTPDACTNRCPSGQTFKTKCCKSYMTESNSGTCVCPTSGYTDNGSSCVSPCTSQQTLTSSGTCVNKCTGSLVWMTSSENSNGMCCESGKKACSTVCCKVDEIESNGHCCAANSYWNTQTKCCTAASGKSGNTKRATFGISQAVILNTADQKADLNLDLALCPQSLSACPINPNSPTGQYECLDSQTDISSCGGCTSLGKGQDCGAIRGARFTGCEAGRCLIFSCRPGWERINGTACVRK